MYDLAVIGGGPAGYSAAFEAVRKRMSVVLFERGFMGGTCLNRGCVPTKYLAHVARKYSEAKSSEIDGMTFQSLKIEYEKTQSRMTDIISTLRDGLEESIKREGITVMKGEACIVDNHSVSCNGVIYDVKNILIATGSVTSTPVVQGALTSDDILKLNKVPERLHIIGGGTVAVEFAHIFRMLGSEVKISIRADRILRKWDKEIAVSLTQSMKKKGIRILNHCDFSSFKTDENEVLFCATGRKAVLPVTENDIYDIGNDGGIVVDENGQTKTKGVFAAGDVVEGSSQLAHVSMEQGRRIVRFIAGEKFREEAAVVRCIYLDQEAASVGITEAEATDRGMEVVSAKQNMFSNARTLISTQERGFIKILAEIASRRVVGAHLCCERAGDIVAELALGINQGNTVEEMLYSVRPHPSYSEAVTEVLRLLEDKLDAL